MKIGNTTKPKWHTTEDIFGKITPQPEIQILPVHWKPRGQMIEQATEIKMIPHPDKPGEYIHHPHFNKWTFTELIIRYAVKGLKHFEYTDGKPVEATPEGIDYLLNELGADFALWLQRLIIRVSDAADEAREVQKEAAVKN